jgi:predicted nucleic acid-binding protein
VRLVLDTNTVLSALLWRGIPYRLPQAIRNQHPSLLLYSSPVLLDISTNRRVTVSEVVVKKSFLGSSGLQAYKHLLRHWMKESLT